MPFDLAKQEKRRGERVLIRIPVLVHGVGQDEKEVAEPAETAVVSRFGALLRVISPLKMDSPVAVTNQYSKETEHFRVAWIAEEKNDGRWDTGIEAANPREDFWGIRFPSSKERKA
jgi:hypothetical protein